MELNHQNLIDEIPKGGIYKERTVSLGTFLGGPLVAGYMIASNYRAFGEPANVRKTWIWTILATLIIFGGAVLFANSGAAHSRSSIIPLLYTYLAFSFTRQFQGTQIRTFLAAGGQAYPWWRAIIVGLIGLLLILAILALTGVLADVSQ